MLRLFGLLGTPDGVDAFGLARLPSGRADEPERVVVVAWRAKVAAFKRHARWCILSRSPTAPDSPMPTGTPLLNDDGTASMATAFMSSHHGFRRDLAQLAGALHTTPDDTRRPLLHKAWTSFHEKLHGHHTIEDTAMFPSMRGAPGLAEIIDGLGADHRRIDPLLERGDAAFAGLATRSDEARAVIAELQALLTEHLATEETHVIPLIRGANTFPAPATEAEVALYADGFAWSLYGLAPEVAAQLLEILPANVRAALPRARAAFEAAWIELWGAGLPQASRFSVPASMQET